MSDPVFTQNLKAKRLHKGLSQTKLGELCGLSNHTISRFEKGSSVPSLDDLRLICDALGTTPDVLMGYTITERKITTIYTKAKPLYG